MKNIQKLSYPQKALFVVLIGLFVLMIIFSIGALKHRGQEGFDNCIKVLCEFHGERSCTKYREVNNCCLGSGGKTVVAEGKPTCIFI